jgi:hypothetical protein
MPPGASTPRGESSQWGDYHAREAALYVKRLAEGAPYLAFFAPGSSVRLPPSHEASADQDADAPRATVERRR